MSYYSLADIYNNLGNVDQSLNCYLQTRDHISSSTQLVESNTHIINLAIQIRNYSLIKNSVIKINSIAINDIDSDTLLIPMAVADLGQSNYSAVVESLTKLTPSSSHPLVTPSDISLYLSLCALTTQSRQDIKFKILDNDALRNKFEFEPHTKLILQHFTTSNYKDLFALLEEYKWSYLLDPHLHHQYYSMVDIIYKRCIIQYFNSFSSISLNNLVNAFGDEQILTLTLTLIKSAELNLRYDAVNKVFHKPQLNTRTTLLNKAIAVSELNHKSTAQLVYRIKLSDANLVLNDRNTQKQPRKDAIDTTDTRHRRNSDQLDDEEHVEIDVEAK